jgi:RNA polymerase sigma-70 factor (ECF subfamily)
MTDRAAAFEEQRSRLYGIAYRMLGSRDDAQDLVQEAYLRWHQADVARVQSPQAFLVTTITRLCIDRLRAAQGEREKYVGPWLPEPLLGDFAPPADAQAELASDLSVAFLVVLERLAPEERAAFLLHEVFDAGYAEIARILAKSEAACRQIVHRARERVQRDRPRFAVSEATRTQLLERFVAALQAEDQEALLALFAQEATWTSDGGGKKTAARTVVRGADLVVRFVLGLWRRRPERTTLRVATVNGEAGLLLEIGGRLESVVAVDTDGARIRAVFNVVNPEKLRGSPADGAAN